MPWFESEHDRKIREHNEAQKQGSRDNFIERFVQHTVGDPFSSQAQRDGYANGERNPAPSHSAAPHEDDKTNDRDRHEPHEHSDEDNTSDSSTADYEVTPDYSASDYSHTSEHMSGTSSPAPRDWRMVYWYYTLPIVWYALLAIVAISFAGKRLQWDDICIFVPGVNWIIVVAGLFFARQNQPLAWALFAVCVLIGATIRSRKE